jgi:hypothetical protein
LPVSRAKPRSSRVSLRSGRLRLLLRAISLQLRRRSVAVAATALGAGSLLAGCTTPRSVSAVEKLQLQGDPYYVEHRRHECASQHAGLVACSHWCVSTLWNVRRISGSPEEQLESLDREMLQLGFQRRDDEDAARREQQEWVLLYQHPEGVGASVLAQRPLPDGMLFAEPQKRDRSKLEGEYVYGIKASYQSPWDRITAGWRESAWNLSWLWSSCPGSSVTGQTLPRSQRQ